MRVCVQCGFTLGEFQARRLLGCPHCYTSLGVDLLPGLLELHPDLHRQEWMPQSPETTTDPGETADLEQLAIWREQLGDALRGEHYEEAARLKIRIRAFEDRREKR